MQDILQAIPVDPDEQITLVGTVAVYCDPNTFPAPQSLLEIKPEMRVAKGLHPRHASFPVRKMDEAIRCFTSLIQHPRVCALGEVGLDRTEPVRDWSSQLILLEKVLPLLQDRHVLILHCRGMDGDCGTEAFLQLLLFVRKHVKPAHPIHLHCFTGNCYVVERWLQTFPNTFFGFTNKIKSFRPDQIDALKMLGEDHLLLESDAPYFTVGRHRVSSPGQLYTVARHMARHRSLSVTKVLQITTTNARNL